MAIYHMQAKVVSRGSGRSAVAASAYMSCSRMYNDYDGVQHDYTRKQGLIYQEVMLPPMAPSKWIDREQLWNAVEETEKTKDSRLAREFVVALPVELDKDSNISLLQDFIKKNFVDMGMCADFAIHDTDGHNPHAHIRYEVHGSPGYTSAFSSLHLSNSPAASSISIKFSAQNTHRARTVFITPSHCCQDSSHSNTAMYAAAKYFLRMACPPQFIIRSISANRFALIK